MWRRGNITWEWGGKQGTQYMELITTAVYTVVGPSPIAGFVIFASMAFWGQYLLFRAFRVALPDGDGKRYAAAGDAACPRCSTGRRASARRRG